VFKAAYALGALAHNFSWSFAGGFLKRLGDVATVLLDLVYLSLFGFFISFRQTDDDQIRSLSGVPAVVRQKYHWTIIIQYF